MIQCTMELPLVTSVLWPEPDTDQYRSRQPHQWTQSSPLIGHLASILASDWSPSLTQHQLEDSEDTRGPGQ